MINVSHQENSNAKPENTITNPTLKNAAQPKAKITTDISKKAAVKPIAGVKTEKKPEKVAKAQPKAQPKAKINKKAAVKPVAGVKTEKKPVKVDKKAQPKAKVNTKVQPKAKTDKKAQPKAKTDKKAQPKAKTDKKAQPKAKTDKKAQPKAKTDKKAQPKAKTDKKAQPKAKVNTKAQPKAKVNTKVPKKAIVKSKAEVKKTEKKPVNAAKAQPKAKVDTKAQPKAKVDPKAQPKPLSLLELHATSKSLVETAGFKIPKGYVMIKGRGNLCIKVARKKRVTQSSCNGTRDVMWRFIAMKGRYIIQNKNGYVLDNYAFNKNNGGPIYGWPKNNKNNQKWAIISLGRGKFELKGNNSGRCIDNTGKARKGVGYHQWSCSRGNKNQHFSIVSSKKRSSVRLPSGYVQIKGKGNLCIHSAFKKRVKQGPCNSSKNALWKFNKVGNAYVIQNKNGQVLNVYASKKNNGAKIYAWNRMNGGNQKFYYIKLRGGKFQLKNVNSRRCLDNTGKSRRGIGYHQWSCNSGNKNQQFQIVSAAKKSSRKRKGSKKSSKGKKGKKMSAKMRRLMNKNKKSSAKVSRAPSGWGMIKGGGNLCIQTAKNKRIRQGPCNRKNNSLWRFVRMGKYYIIQNKSGYVLDNYAFKRNNGGPIFAWRRNNKKNQKWSYLKIGGGKFEIKGLNSGKCLDNTGKARNRVGYHQWSCSSGNKNQHFTFVRSGRSKRGGRKGKSSKKGSKKGRKGSKKGSRKGRRGSRKGRRGSRKGRRGSRKGRKGSRKGRRGGKRGKNSTKRAAKRAAIKAARKFNKKPKSGYKNRKNIKFMGGKYKFNLVTGRAFCTKKCKPNASAPMKKCFKGTVQNCQACSFTGNKKDKDSAALCASVCNAIHKEKTCEFYTFIDAKKKVINKRLLTRFGRIFIKKYLKKK